jgi:hypothetical protein
MHNLTHQKNRAQDMFLARKQQLTKPRFLRQTCVALASLALGIAAFAPSSASAAASEGCDGGGFTVLGISGDQRTTVSAGSVPSTFLVKGKYVEFTVDAATFGLYNWTLTGAANPLDITGGKRTVVFSSKLPDHRGLVLTGDITVDNKEGSLVISREGPGLSMKIQAKDCANGGLFQVEVERDDLTATVFTHTLGDGAFYYDNPNVRDLLGENLPCSGILPDGTQVVCKGANPDGTVTVTARTNIGNDFSDKFVGRDSPQSATRITNTACSNDIPNPFHPGTVDHCGGVSQWSVSSGGRMGQVMGEDATEIAPAATACVKNCTAQNQVNGKAVVVGFPFPVPAEVRFEPRTSTPGTGVLSAVTLSASSVTGGSTAQGVATLNGTAPVGGVFTTLTSSNSVVASVPASVTIPAGATSVEFTINTTAVTAPSPVTLTANAAGLTKSTILSVNPPGLPVTDTVAIQRAEYTTSKKTLRVEATSSNKTVTMTVTNSSTGAVLGTLANKGGGKYEATLSVATNPVNITVKSSSGGSATRAVTVK